ncbi:MAG: ABC transporter substrate-binding protein [Treponema sp.]|nr:ABC transporter substrate-binding protein [Treponema sp.]
MKRKNFPLSLTFATVLVVLAVLAFSALALTGCNSPQKRTGIIHIGHPSAGGDWPNRTFGVAVTNGYLDEYLAPLGYKYESKSFLGAAPAIHEALVAKELEYVVYAGMASVLSKANNIDHTLISVTGWGGNWKMVVSNNSGIETLADLKGKKIAYMRGASPHMYLLKVLKEAGVEFNEIEAINTNLPEGLAGIASGTLDAAVASGGQEKQLVQEGIAKVLHTQFYADRDVYFEPTVFIARTDFHREHPEVAVAIQKAFYKARDWIREDPDRYFNLVSEKTGIPLDVVLETADYNIDGSHPLNLDDVYIDSLKDILGFLKDNELTKGNIDFPSWPDRTVAVKAWEVYNSGK